MNSDKGQDNQFLLHWRFKYKFWFTFKKSPLASSLYHEPWSHIKLPNIESIHPDARKTPAHAFWLNSMLNGKVLKPFKSDEVVVKCSS